jgi:tetratricopeptide (TPR) repeat protein
LTALLFLTAPVFSQDDDDGKDPVKFFQQGQDAHEKGDLKKALELYDEALAIAPEFPEAEFQKGIALVTLGRLDEAEASFRRALELRADWTPPMSSLGALLVKTGRFPEAEKILVAAIKLDEQNFPAFAALTDLYLTTKASPEILKGLLARLQVLTSKMRPPAMIWISRAAVERYLGDYAAARTSAGKALAIDQKNIPALQEHGEASLAASDSTEALNDSEAILKLAPDSLDGKLLRARSQAAAGNLDDALKTLDSLEERGKQTPAYRSVRQAIDAARSDAGDNLAELEKQIAADPKNVAALARLCIAARKADPPKALDYCRRAAELEPANMSHVIGYAAALVQSRQFDQAVQLLRRVITAAPDNFTAHANLATALLELKRYPEAIVEYEWLVEKKPDLAIGHYFLAIAYDSALRLPDAMLSYKKFLSLADPGYNKAEIENVNLRLPALARQIEKLKKSRN